MINFINYIIWKTELQENTVDFAQDKVHKYLGILAVYFRNLALLFKHPNQGCKPNGKLVESTPNIIVFLADKYYRDALLNQILNLRISIEVFMIVQKQDLHNKI